MTKLYTKDIIQVAVIEVNMIEVIKFLQSCWCEWLQ